MKTISMSAAVLMLSGCASIFSGTTQDVSIRTTPGARYTVTNTYGTQVASGTSEGTANLQRGASYFSPHAYKLRASKEGYKPRTMDIQPGINPWYFANILIGGVVGMVIVDPLTGAMYNLHPNSIDIHLDPVTPGSEPTAASPAPATAKVATKTVSRFDYAASQVARQAGCKTNDNPEVITDKSARETLIFSCSNGEKLAVKCSSQSGCE